MTTGVRTRFLGGLRRAILRRAPLRAPPFTLAARGIYILPTRNGLYFAALVFVMLLGSMNYSNSLGFALTFLLAAAGLVAMHQTQRNLLRVGLQCVAAEPVFAGDAAEFDIELGNDTGRARYAIRIRIAGSAAAPVDLGTNGRAVARLRCATFSRGRLACPRLRLETVYPMGLFRAWSWLAVDNFVLVYPQPLGTAALPQAGAGDGAASADERAGDAEFAGHRAYAAGDNPRTMDWKASARTDALIVVRYADNTRDSELWLDAASLSHLPAEARLSQLARWVVDAENSGRCYGLRLPDECLAPAFGHTHARACLTALALQP